MTSKKDYDLENPWGSKYREDMCLEIIEMFSKGKTRSQFCAKHTISEDTYIKWRKRHKLFDAACIVAHEKARTYYDEMRQRYLEMDREGDRTIHWPMFNRMYNVRFNLADKRKVKVKGLGKAKDEKAMLKCLTEAVAEGELTPDEAQKLGSLIDISIKVKQTGELEKRIEELEVAKQTGFED